MPTTAGTGYYTTTLNNGQAGPSFANHNHQSSYSMGTSATNNKPAINVNNGTNLTMTHATVNTQSQYNVQFNNTIGISEKGSMRFDTANGNMEVFDGKEWVIVAGLGAESTRLERVINILLEDYPEVAADLVLRGEIE